MRILLVTDAWEPQVNGVVRTLKTTARELTAMGHEVRFLTPLEFRTLPCPTYPEIRLSLLPQRGVNQRIREFDPDVLHIATEGPLGMAARRFALRNDFPFTTAYHTRFPEYVHARMRLPLTWSYAWLRRFHAPSRGVMAPTQVVVDDLVANGFERVRLWSRGVDTDIFQSAAEQEPEQRAADLPVRRPGGGGEERRGVPRARSAGIEVGGGHGPGARIASACSTPRLTTWGCSTARNSRRCMPRPTCSCSRARPTRSAWCCWRPWPAACRWRPIR